MTINLVKDEYNNTYHRRIGKKPSHADYSVLTEEIDTNSIAPKFKVGYRVRIIEYKNIFSKYYTENWLK